MARVIRELRPEVVLGHDPWKRYRLHPDHRHAGWLVCDAIVAARDPHFFPEHGLAPHRPSALLLWEADEPNHVEDVTAFVDRKLAALEAHESQFESTMHAADAERARRVPRPRPRPAWPSSARRTAWPPPRSSPSIDRSRDVDVGRAGQANWPGRRPGPGGPANAWAMSSHSSAAGALGNEVDVVAVAALGDEQAEVERRPGDPVGGVVGSPRPRRRRTGRPARRGPAPGSAARPLAT